MDFFKQLNTHLKPGHKINVLIEGGAIMICSVIPDADDEDLSPVIMRGNPTELDEGFIGAISKKLAEAGLQVAEVKPDPKLPAPKSKPKGKPESTTVPEAKTAVAPDLFKQEEAKTAKVEPPKVEAPKPAEPVVEETKDDGEEW